MDDLANIVDGVIQNMFGELEPAKAKAIIAPKPEPEPEPTSVSVTGTFTPPPLPTPVTLKTGTSMTEKAKAAAAGKMLETVMSQITPQIQRMVADAPVSAEVKADAEQRLTITAQNIVTTALNDGMSGKMPNPKQLLDAVMKDVTALAIELLGTVTVDIEVAGAGGESGTKGELQQQEPLSRHPGFISGFDGDLLALFSPTADTVLSFSTFTLKFTNFFNQEHLHKYGLGLNVGFNLYQGRLKRATKDWYGREYDEFREFEAFVDLRSVYRLGSFNKYIETTFSTGFGIGDIEGFRSMLSVAGRYRFLSIELEQSIVYDLDVTRLKFSLPITSTRTKRHGATRVTEYIPSVVPSWCNGKYSTVFAFDMKWWKIK